MIWREKPRRNISGSSWLPDTEYGALAPVTDNYLRTNLARVTGDDRTKALVVYCLRDCWMSWNAAKRILALGYANVVWYPNGTDGGAEADLPLQESMPPWPSRSGGRPESPVAAKEPDWYPSIARRGRQLSPEHFNGARKAVIE
jgi:rhodanese-related sulfurtransferase